MKYCQNCGTQLEDDAKFCHNCGSPIDEAQPEAYSATPETQSVVLDTKEKTAGSVPDFSKESTSSGVESAVQKNAVPKKRSFRWVLYCILIVVVIAVLFSQCARTSKAQILETAKSFTLDNSDMTLGESVETNLSDVEWTCYDQDDGYWTVTVSGYNANEDATVTLLIGVTEINDDQVYYETIYGEVNGSGSSEASDINYAIAIVYDNVGQALVDNLTSYLLGI